MSHHESPPQEPPSVYCTPSPQSKATTPSPSPLSRITIPSPFARFLSRQSSVKPSPQTKLVLSRQHSFSTTNSHTLPREYPYEHITNKTSNRLLLRSHRHTNPAIWCSAIICLIFSVLLIIFGLATLIIFLVVKPKTPVFDISRANLSTIYFDELAGNFNGDFAFLANISNPNKKLNVKFEHAVIELLFQNDVIGTQAMQPFSQRHKETGAVVIHFVSSLVPLPPNLAIELRSQVLSNKVFYSVRGTFKVRASFGALHFTYWLHGWCDLQMTSPPSGSLTGRTCKTKK